MSTCYEWRCVAFWNMSESFSCVVCEFCSGLFSCVCFGVLLVQLWFSAGAWPVVYVCLIRYICIVALKLCLFYCLHIATYPTNSPSDSLLLCSRTLIKLFSQLQRKGNLLSSVTGRSLTSQLLRKGGYFVLCSLMNSRWDHRGRTHLNAMAFIKNVVLNCDLSDIFFKSWKSRLLRH